jgi:hypothetical protein
VADSLAGHVRRFSLGSVIDRADDLFLRYLRTP